MVRFDWSGGAYCARESSMSMLMEVSRAFVLMKASLACSWSSHAHVRAGGALEPPMKCKEEAVYGPMLAYIGPKS